MPGAIITPFDCIFYIYVYYNQTRVKLNKIGHHLPPGVVIFIHLFISTFLIFYLPTVYFYWLNLLLLLFYFNVTVLLKRVKVSLLEELFAKMPLFGTRKAKKDEHLIDNNNVNEHKSKIYNSPKSPAPPTEDNKPKLIFHCQLAHGSPTGLISGFSNVRELYQKIAECYEFPTEEVRC